MRCGLIVYSTTVLVVTLTLLSFYLPAMLYHVRNSNLRIGGHFLQPAQANFAMPNANAQYPGLGAPFGLGGGRNARSANPERRGAVMMVTANQPLPCTTRRGDWIMELALRNKLMYATHHGGSTWLSSRPPGPACAP